MGSLFLGKKKSGGEQLFAIKALREGTMASLEAKTTLQREAAVLQKLWHPCIEQYETAFAFGENFYLVKRFIPGVSLAQLCQFSAERGQLYSLDFALFVVEQMLQGIVYLHSHADLAGAGKTQLLHGDLSPRNVIVGADGTVRLIDFGLARFPKTPFGVSEKESLASLGYCSPDRLLHHRLSVSDDLFAVGVVFWEMVVGKRFWGERTAAQIIHAATDFSVENIPEQWPEFPQGVECILRSALSQSSFSGYFEAQDFLTDIEGLIAARSVGYSQVQAAREIEGVYTKLVPELQGAIETLRGATLTATPVRPATWAERLRQSLERVLGRTSR